MSAKFYTWNERENLEATIIMNAVIRSLVETLKENGNDYQSKEFQDKLTRAKNFVTNKYNQISEPFEDTTAQYNEIMKF
jgi:hypothetical protein